MDDIAQVSLATMESALSHLQEANKRLARLLALSWLVVALIVGCVLYFVTHFELVASDVQSILDQMCQDKIDSKNEQILELQNRVNMAVLQASQTAQTAEILAKLPATTTTGA